MGGISAGRMGGVDGDDLCSTRLLRLGHSLKALDEIRRRRTSADTTPPPARECGPRAASLGRTHEVTAMMVQVRRVRNRAAASHHPWT